MGYYVKVNDAYVHLYWSWWPLKRLIAERQVPDFEEAADYYWQSGSRHRLVGSPEGVVQLEAGGHCFACGATWRGMAAYHHSDCAYQ